MSPETEIKIRELDTVELLEGCISLQESVFDMPMIEISPLRHFIVTKHAGGFTLGAFVGDRLVGFNLSVPAFLDGADAFYSHMTAIETGYQSHGIGTVLKFAQRKEALRRGIDLVKWTFQPEKSHNAYFNLEKLGAEVREHIPNFYGSDYPAAKSESGGIALRSDRLFAVWRLKSPKATALAEDRSFEEPASPAAVIRAVPDWNELMRIDRAKASAEQDRLRSEFNKAFDIGLICRGFRKGAEPQYLLYDE